MITSLRHAIPLLVGLHLLAWHTGTAWLDPSPHQVRFASVDSSVRLEVLDWGGRGRPVVLLACYLTAHVYDDLAPKLASQFHVYGITRRGLGASDKPAAGYSVERSADDVVEVLDSLNLERPLLIGNACAGQVLTLLGSQRSDRLGGLVYLDAADDPTLKLTDYGVPLIDPARLPASVKPAPSPDYSSFEAYRIAQQRDHGVAFPEAELRQLFAANPDGSMGRPLLSPAIRKAIVDDNSNVKPQYAGIRIPVLAIFRTALFKEVERDSPPRNEEERTALRAKHAFGRAMVSRWERDLLAGVPTARIVELAGANLYMFLSNEADVVDEHRVVIRPDESDQEEADRVGKKGRPKAREVSRQGDVRGWRMKVKHQESESNCEHAIRKRFKTGGNHSDALQGDFSS